MDIVALDSVLHSGTTVNWEPNNKFSSDIFFIASKSVIYTNDIYFVFIFVDSRRGKDGADSYHEGRIVKKGQNWKMWKHPLCIDKDGVPFSINGNIPCQVVSDKNMWFIELEHYYNNNKDKIIFNEFNINKYSHIFNLENINQN